MEKTNRQCLQCASPLKGRADKKFCDVYCRNAYNNEQRAGLNSFVRKVENILRRNRRILEGLVAGHKSCKKFRKDKLVRLGFIFGYHTHSFRNRAGSMQYYCYDMGYRMPDKEAIIVFKASKANTTDAVTELSYSDP